MIAHVAALTGTSDQLSEIGRVLTVGTLPALEEREGFRGMLWLTDPSHGKAILIGLWTSDEARQAASRSWDEQVPASERVGVRRELLGTFEVSLQRVHG